MSNLRSGIYRAARTWLQTFLATVLASGPLDLVGTSTIRAAAIAGVAAVLAVLHRALDQTPVSPIPPG